MFHSGVQALAGIVVDAGFSFTHTVPFFGGAVLLGGVRRLALGGKHLTNYLKELVSFRSLNMADEAYLVEHVKDALSFVSQARARAVVALLQHRLHALHK
jgi:actin-related protein 6